MELYEKTGRSGCAADGLAQIVDKQINGGARREFADAALQESGADLGSGHTPHTT